MDKTLLLKTPHSLAKVYCSYARESGTRGEKTYESIKKIVKDQLKKPYKELLEMR